MSDLCYVCIPGEYSISLLKPSSVWLPGYPFTGKVMDKNYLGLLLLFLLMGELPQLSHVWDLIRSIVGHGTLRTLNGQCGIWNIDYLGGTEIETNGIYMSIPFHFAESREFEKARVFWFCREGKEIKKWFYEHSRWKVFRNENLVSLKSPSVTIIYSNFSLTLEFLKLSYNVFFKFVLLFTQEFSVREIGANSATLVNSSIRSHLRYYICMELPSKTVWTLSTSLQKHISVIQFMNRPDGINYVQGKCEKFDFNSSSKLFTDSLNAMYINSYSWGVRVSCPKFREDFGYKWTGILNLYYSQYCGD